MSITIESHVPDPSSTVLSIARAASILDISTGVLRKGLAGGTIPDLSMRTISDLAAREVLTRVELDGNPVPVLRPGNARRTDDERPFSGWAIDETPEHTQTGLDRWWTPSGRELIFTGGGYLLAVGSIVCGGIRLRSHDVEEREGRLRYDAEIAGLLRSGGQVEIYAEGSWGDLLPRVIGKRVLGGEGGNFTSIG